MNDDGRRKPPKVQENRVEVNQPTVVALPHGASLSNLLRVPSVAIQTQAGVTLIDPSLTQTMPFTNTQPQTHSQNVLQSNAQIQAQTQRLLESLVQTQIQSDVQTNVHCLPDVQNQAEVLVTQTQSLIPSHQHLHTHPLAPVQQPHDHMQAQQTDAQVHLQAQMPVISQTPIMHTLGDLVHTQIEEDTKTTDDLAAVRIPITLQQHHNPNAVNLQDLQSAGLDLNDLHQSNSQAKLLNAINFLTESSQLNAGGVQQGNMSLTQALTQQLTSAQVIEALMTDRVLVTSKNNLCQTTVAPTASSVSTPVMDGIPLMRVQGNYTTARPEDAVSALVTQEKLTSRHNVLLENQMLHPQISASQLHLDASKVEGSQASNMSNLITSNKILNRLLDNTKPHIPSHVAKAAELAHLIPNPSVRTASTTRAGDLENGTLDMTFSTSSRGSSPLTTLTRSSGTSMCTVTGALRSSSGYCDSGNKTSTLPLENVNLPSVFQLNNGSLLLSTLTSQNTLQPQKQYDMSEQTLLTSQTTSGIEDSQLDRLTNDSLRLFTTPTHGQNSPVSNCIVSGINILSSTSSDKNPKKNFVPSSNQGGHLRHINPGGAMEVIHKGSNVMEQSHLRSQMSLCSRQGMITSTDPMFSSVVTSVNSPSTSSSNVYGTPKSGMMSSHDNMARQKLQVGDTRMSHLALTDVINRTSSSDILLSAGTGNLLLGMTDTRIPHTGDVLLSELHRSDESELSLSSSLTGTGDDLHGNAGTLVTETSLGTGMVADTAPLHGLPSSPPLQGLPSPPLPGFSLPHIASDFMVGGISGSKLSSSQAPFPALLSNLNLATTSDFDQLLDINSLSESEVSLSTAPRTYAYSPEKPSSKKSSSSPSADLTFTNALKAATSKNDSDDLKLHCDVDIPVRSLEQPHLEVKSSQVDLIPTCSPSIDQNFVVAPLNQHCGSAKSSQSHTKSQDTQEPNKLASSQKGKRKEMFKKNELLVQQVACFKCRLCSFLSQDKEEIVTHMKQLHSQYMSDSEESDAEMEDNYSSKKVKVHLPKRDAQEMSASEESPLAEKGKSKNSRKQAKKVDNTSIVNYNSESESLFKKMIKEEDVTVNSLLVMKTEPQESYVNRTKLESNQNVDDDDTNDSSITSDSGNAKPKKTNSKVGRPMFSKVSGITRFKKQNPNVKVPENVIGIRCDVNGCGFRMMSESNIEYHRKCHVGAMLTCQECGASFGMWCNLALHLWRQHMIDMELFKCDKCPYKAYSLSKLMNVHYNIHSDDRPSLCDICGKRFKTAKQLRSHKAVHIRKMNAPQHRCEKCQRPFSDKRMLRNHMKSVHNKVKPFLCNYCGYSTASRSTLKMHMRQHTGEKPFACEKCSYRTADHNSLRRHRMQHSGVRPYRCPYCDYASIQATTFKVHLRDKHPCLAQVDGIVFTCGICKYVTIKKDNYLAHVAEHGRGESKKSPPSSSNNKIPPGTILAATPVPHVVNIDVESGAVTVENPQGNTYMNSVNVQEENLQTAQVSVPADVAMSGDQYIYATVDSSMLSRVKSGKGIMRIAPDVVAIPLSVASETGGTSAIQGLVYVATSSQGGE